MHVRESIKELKVLHKQRDDELDQYRAEQRLSAEVFFLAFDFYLYLRYTNSVWFQVLGFFTSAIA